MDKNSIIGIVLIGAILLVFTIMNRPSEEEKAERARQDSIALVKAQERQEQMALEAKDEKVVESKEYVGDVDTSKHFDNLYGAFAAGGYGQDEFYTLENNLVKVKFLNKGGKVYSVELKEHKNHEGDPLLLFDGSENIFGFNFFAQNRQIATSDLFFVTSETEKSVVLNEGDNPHSISWKLSAGEGRYIEYVYTLAPESYALDFKVNLKGLNGIVPANANMLDLKWFQQIPQTEKGTKFENQYTTIAFKHASGDVDELSSRGKDKDENISTRVKWVGFKKQFFTTFLTAEEDFSNAYVKYHQVEDIPGVIKTFDAEIGIPVRDFSSESVNLKFHFIPNSYPTLKALEQDYEKVIPLGGKMMSWFNKLVVIKLFNWLDNYIVSYGLIILIMTLFIKLIIFPLTYKSYMSTAKMKVLKPEIDEIGKKFPKQEDSMKKQQATMGLYKKAGINPLGGCLPLLIQFPILIAMFRFFPAAIELRQKSFLWATDLSSYDAIVSWSTHIPLVSDYYGNHISLFTVLMAVALIVSTRINSAAQTEASAQMPGMKFMMNWMMPIMMIFWFNSYAAGLSYYYFLSNVITIGQTYAIRKFVNEDEIRAKLKANTKKTVKKSKWQAKLENIAKQQQQAKKK